MRSVCGRYTCACAATPFLLLLPAHVVTGKALESWRLSEIKRDDYSPNTAGQRQWEADRRTWLANRLKGVMKEAGGWVGRSACHTWLTHGSLV